MALEVLLDPELKNKVGRAPNGNAVISSISAEAVSVADPSKREPIKLTWAWADYSQQNGDFDVTSLLRDEDPKGDRVWALDGHNRKDGRVALFLAEKPFGFDAGTEIQFKLRSHSRYDQHTPARIRVSFGTINDAGLAKLPHAASRWYLVGPFPGDDRTKVYDAPFGPEEGDGLDFARNFGFGNQYWRFDVNLVDGKPVPLADGLNVSYVGRSIYSPTARDVEVSLGSDDAFKLYLNGAEAAAKFVERAVAPDQDKATLHLRAGLNTLVFKVVNTGGNAAYYYKSTDPSVLQGDLVAAVLPGKARSEPLEARLDQSWRIAFLPSYRKAKGGSRPLTSRPPRSPPRSPGRW
jgi:hypothetical protein